MIDLHTHLLPNIDDGASDISEALIMTKLLKEEGIKGAVCTPHYDPTSMSLNDFTSLRAKSLNLLKETCIPLIPASETYLHEYLFYNCNLDPLTIENTNYLLIELPFTKKWGNDIYKSLEKLMIYFDVIPIIAHIERYPAASKKNINRLKELGCVLQLNTSSLLQSKLKKKALSYMKKEFIDVLGSDCHNLKNRSPQVKIPLELIREQLGQGLCDEFAKRSEKVIKGIDIR